MADFLLGINYWPRSSAMYMWERFDIGEIREDCARIAELGMKVVRFFLLWEAFQPKADEIDSVMLERLDEVMQALTDAKLWAMPTFFTGHMSDVNWIPAWALDPQTPHGRFRTYAGGRESPFGIGDFYSGELLATQRLQVRTIGTRYRDHPVLLAWDLGNEFSNMREPHSPQEAAAWSAALTTDLLETSGVCVTGGIHGEDISRDRRIRPSSIAAPWSFATMHGYPVYSGFARSRTDPEVVPYLSQITQSCAGKPVLFSELGAPSCPPGKGSPYEREPLPGEPVPLLTNLPPNCASYACLSEAETADYAYAALDRLQQRGALGGFWWCWADYDPALASLPPFDQAKHEMRFGIIREDGDEKAVAQILKRFAAETRQTTALPEPIVNEAAYYARLPKAIDDDYRAYLTLHR